MKLPLRKMFLLGTLAYARIHYSTFVFLSFTSFTTAAILSKSPSSVNGFVQLDEQCQNEA